MSYLNATQIIIIVIIVLTVQWIIQTNSRLQRMDTQLKTMLDTHFVQNKINVKQITPAIQQNYGNQSINLINYINRLYPNGVYPNRLYQNIRRQSDSNETISPPSATVQLGPESPSYMSTYCITCMKLNCKCDKKIVYIGPKYY